MLLLPPGLFLLNHAAWRGSSSPAASAPGPAAHATGRSSPHFLLMMLVWPLCDSKFFPNCDALCDDTEDHHRLRRTFCTTTVLDVV